MPAFNAARAGITPDTSKSNWVLEADAGGEIGHVIGFGWGGEATASTAMNTRWVRPTADGAGAVTTIADEPSNPNYGTSLLAAYFIFATTQETIPASPASLHEQSWNCHGGSGYIALPQRAPWTLFNDGGAFDARMAVSCRNATGTGTSSYSVTWEE